MPLAGPIPSVDVHEAARRVSEGSGEGSGSSGGTGPGAVLVDVREDYEVAEVRVPGAVHVPLGDLAARYEELPGDRPLLVMCAAGRRSLVAAEFLRRNGYADVTNVTGGIIEWQRAGLPTTSGGAQRR